MTDKYVRIELPWLWKSLTTGNEFNYSEYANIEEKKAGKLPLPESEYPFTIIYKQRETPLWKSNLKNTNT